MTFVDGTTFLTRTIYAYRIGLVRKPGQLFGQDSSKQFIYLSDQRFPSGN